ncbi:MAG: choice-of-anchor L domain-containing protein [Bacteroidota bacterium]|nr:choice-of-anchor L domain-containing protein [Bacteroidota bacterium]
MKKSSLLLIFFGISLSSFCQLSTTSAPTTTQIINQLQGNGVQISNVQTECDSNAYGLFQGTSELPMSNGILLCTGYASNIAGPQPFNADTCMFHNNTSGWGELTQTYPTATFDYCRISFSILPVGDTLKFGFVFGSEEYTGLRKNDASAICISGSNPSGGQYDSLNIGWVGNPNFMVCVMNVNYLVWQQYWQPNSSPAGQLYSYDASTTYLQRKIAVVPNQSYYISLSIADFDDCNFDSGLFVDGFSSDSIALGIQENANQIFSAKDIVELYDISGRRIWMGSNSEFPFVKQELPSGIYVTSRYLQNGESLKQKFGIIR